MTRLMKAYRTWRKVTLAGAVLSGLAIFGLMCLIVLDVARRNTIGGSLPGSFEMAQNYFMPVAVFPALAHVYGSGTLPKMDLLLPKLPSRARDLTTHALLALEACLLVVILYFTWDFAMGGMERGVSYPAGGSLYVLWPLFFLVPIGFAMVLVEVIFAIIGNLTTGPAQLTLTGPGDRVDDE